MRPIKGACDLSIPAWGFPIGIGGWGHNVTLHGEVEVKLRSTY